MDYLDTKRPSTVATYPLTQSADITRASAIHCISGIGIGSPNAHAETLYIADESGASVGICARALKT